jgi:hypothetical protein
MGKVLRKAQLRKTIKSSRLEDAGADIALFGRMVASDPDL